MEKQKEQLIKYIREQLQLGVQESILINTVKSAGWTDEDYKEMSQIAKSQISSINNLSQTLIKTIPTDTTYPVFTGKPKSNHGKLILIISILLIFFGGVSFAYMNKDILLNIPLVKSFVEKTGLSRILIDTRIETITTATSTESVATTTESIATSILEKLPAPYLLEVDFYATTTSSSTTVTTKSGGGGVTADDTLLGVIKNGVLKGYEVYEGVFVEDDYDPSNCCYDFGDCNLPCMSVVIDDFVLINGERTDLEKNGFKIDGAVYPNSTQ